MADLITWANSYLTKQGKSTAQHHPPFDTSQDKCSYMHNNVYNIASQYNDQKAREKISSRLQSQI